MADIFISYAREDEVRIHHLASALEEQGWSVFWDRRIPAGQTWHSYLGRALREAACIVVAWSHHSISSRWVIEEAEEGQQRGKLVPVRLDPVEPPLGFRGIQAGDLTAWQPGHPSPHLAQLVQDINVVLWARPTPPGAHGAVTLPQQPPAVPSRRLTHALLAVIFVLVIGIIGYWGSNVTNGPSPRTWKHEEGQNPAKQPQEQTQPVENSTGTDPRISRSEPAQGSALMVSGDGKALYTVYDASGQKQLSGTLTGHITELLPGTYQVELNNIRHTVTVQANQRIVIETGALIVSGDGKALYTVYDASGQKRLSGTLTGHITELLPGMYQVELNQNRVIVQVRAKEKTPL